MSVEDAWRGALALTLLVAILAPFATAAPLSDSTELEAYDEEAGCYYNFQHYGEGDRIMTNEPCLNCTCHNRMLMCYLRVCPFTKPIGQDCTVEKRGDQCCPIITCPDVHVGLVDSTTVSTVDSTEVGHHDNYGCSIDGKFYSDGAQVPSSANKPCELCYCIRNMTACVMQECTLHVEGCTPVYLRGLCCPVRYSCDHPEDEGPLMIDDMTTTVRPTPGFILTTTLTPGYTMECTHNDQIYADGALIATDKACEHCYCMKGDIVCAVQDCGTPMENEGKNCTAHAPREGQCCPDTYVCDGDEDSTTALAESEKDSSTHTAKDDQHTEAPTHKDNVTTLKSGEHEQTTEEKVSHTTVESIPQTTVADYEFTNIRDNKGDDEEHSENVTEHNIPKENITQDDISSEIENTSTPKDDTSSTATTKKHIGDSELESTTPYKNIDLEHEQTEANIVKSESTEKPQIDNVFTETPTTKTFDSVGLDSVTEVAKPSDDHFTSQSPTTNVEDKITVKNDQEEEKYPNQEHEKQELEKLEPPTHLYPVSADKADDHTDESVTKDATMTYPLPSIYQTTKDSNVDTTLSPDQNIFTNAPDQTSITVEINKDELDEVFETSTTKGESTLSDSLNTRYTDEDNSNINKTNAPSLSVTKPKKEYDEHSTDKPLPESSGDGDFEKSTPNYDHEITTEYLKNVQGVEDSKKDFDQEELLEKHTDKPTTIIDEENITNKNDSSDSVPDYYHTTDSSQVNDEDKKSNTPTDSMFTTQHSVSKFKTDKPTSETASFDDFETTTHLLKGSDNKESDEDQLNIEKNITTMNPVTSTAQSINIDTNGDLLTKKPDATRKPILTENEKEPELSIDLKLTTSLPAEEDIGATTEQENLTLIDEIMYEPTTVSGLKQEPQDEIIDDKTPYSPQNLDEIVTDVPGPDSETKLYEVDDHEINTPSSYEETVHENTKTPILSTDDDQGLTSFNPEKQTENTEINTTTQSSVKHEIGSDVPEVTEIIHDSTTLVIDEYLTSPHSDTKFTQDGKTKLGDDLTESTISTTPPSITEYKEDSSKPTITDSSKKPQSLDITTIGQSSEKNSETTEHLEHIATTLPDFVEKYATMSTDSSVTEINEEDNEISEDHDKHPLTEEEPSRVPGEGDCLLDGISYKNKALVPTTNRCQTSCRCTNSILKCDHVVCSPPPLNMVNCQPVYHGKDTCCPMYTCEHESVTIESDNQMSEMSTLSQKDPIIVTEAAIKEDGAITEHIPNEETVKPVKDDNINLTKTPVIEEPIVPSIYKPDCGTSGCNLHQKQEDNIASDLLSHTTKFPYDHEYIDQKTEVDNVSSEFTTLQPTKDVVKDDDESKSELPSEEHEKTTLEGPEETKIDLTIKPEVDQHEIATEKETVTELEDLSSVPVVTERQGITTVASEEIITEQNPTVEEVTKVGVKEGSETQLPNLPEDGIKSDEIDIQQATTIVPEAVTDIPNSVYDGQKINENEVPLDNNKNKSPTTSTEFDNVSDATEPNISDKFPDSTLQTKTPIVELSTISPNIEFTTISSDDVNKIGVSVLPTDSVDDISPKKPEYPVLGGCGKTECQVEAEYTRHPIDVTTTEAQATEDCITGQNCLQTSPASKSPDCGEHGCEDDNQNIITDDNDKPICGVNGCGDQSTKPSSTTQKSELYPKFTTEISADDSKATDQYLIPTEHPSTAVKTDCSGTDGLCKTKDEIVDSSNEDKSPTNNDCGAQGCSDTKKPVQTTVVPEIILEDCGEQGCSDTKKPVQTTVDPEIILEDCKEQGCSDTKKSDQTTAVPEVIVEECGEQGCPDIKKPVQTTVVPEIILEDCGEQGCSDTKKPVQTTVVPEVILEDCGERGCSDTKKSDQTTAVPEIILEDCGEQGCPDIKQPVQTTIVPEIILEGCGEQGCSDTKNPAQTTAVPEIILEDCGEQGCSGTKKPIQTTVVPEIILEDCGQQGCSDTKEPVQSTVVPEIISEDCGEQGCSDAKKPNDLSIPAKECGEHGCTDEEKLVKTTSLPETINEDCGENGCDFNEKSDFTTTIPETISDDCGEKDCSEVKDSSHTTSVPELISPQKDCVGKECADISHTTSIPETVSENCQGQGCSDFKDHSSQTSTLPELDGSEKPLFVQTEMPSEIKSPSLLPEHEINASKCIGDDCSIKPSTDIYKERDEFSTTIPILESDDSSTETNIGKITHSDLSTDGKPSTDKITVTDDTATESFGVLQSTEHTFEPKETLAPQSHVIDKDSEDSEQTTPTESEQDLQHSTDKEQQSTTKKYEIGTHAIPSFTSPEHITQVNDITSIPEIVITEFNTELPLKSDDKKTSPEYESDKVTKITTQMIDIYSTESITTDEQPESFTEKYENKYDGQKSTSTPESADTSKPIDQSEINEPDKDETENPTTIPRVTVPQSEEGIGNESTLPSFEVESTTHVVISSTDHNEKVTKNILEDTHRPDQTILYTTTTEGDSNLDSFNEIDKGEKIFASTPIYDTEKNYIAEITTYQPTESKYTTQESDSKSTLDSDGNLPAKNDRFTPSDDDLKTTTIINTIEKDYSSQLDSETANTTDLSHEDNAPTVTKKTEKDSEQILTTDPGSTDATTELHIKSTESTKNDGLSHTTAYVDSGIDDQEVVTGSPDLTDIKYSTDTSKVDENTGTPSTTLSSEKHESVTQQIQSDKSTTTEDTGKDSTTNIISSDNEDKIKYSTNTPIELNKGQDIEQSIDLGSEEEDSSENLDTKDIYKPLEKDSTETTVIPGNDFVETPIDDKLHQTTKSEEPKIEDVSTTSSEIKNTTNVLEDVVHTTIAYNSIDESKSTIPKEDNVILTTENPSNEFNASSQEPEDSVISTTLANDQYDTKKATDKSEIYSTTVTSETSEDKEPSDVTNKPIDSISDENHDDLKPTDQPHKEITYTTLGFDTEKEIKPTEHDQDNNNNNMSTTIKNETEKSPEETDDELKIATEQTEPAVSDHFDEQKIPDDHTEINAIEPEKDILHTTLAEIEITTEHFDHEISPTTNRASLDEKTQTEKFATSVSQQLDEDQKQAGEPQDDISQTTIKPDVENPTEQDEKDVYSTVDDDIEKSTRQPEKDITHTTVNVEIERPTEQPEKGILPTTIFDESSTSQTEKEVSSPIHEDTVKPTGQPEKNIPTSISIDTEKPTEQPEKDFAITTTHIADERPTEQEIEQHAGQTTIHADNEKSSEKPEIDFSQTQTSYDKPTEQPEDISYTTMADVQRPTEKEVVHSTGYAGIDENDQTVDDIIATTRTPEPEVKSPTEQPENKRTTTYLGSGIPTEHAEQDVTEFTRLPEDDDIKTHTRTESPTEQSEISHTTASPESDDKKPDEIIEITVNPDDNKDIKPSEGSDVDVIIGTTDKYESKKPTIEPENKISYTTIEPTSDEYERPDEQTKSSIDLSSSEKDDTKKPTEKTDILQSTIKPEISRPTEDIEELATHTTTSPERFTDPNTYTTENIDIVKVQQPTEGILSTIGEIDGELPKTEITTPIVTDIEHEDDKNIDSVQLTEKPSQTLSPHNLEKETHSPRPSDEVSTEVTEQPIIPEDGEPQLSEKYPETSHDENEPSEQSPEITTQSDIFTASNKSSEYPQTSTITVHDYITSKTPITEITTETPYPEQHSVSPSKYPDTEIEPDLGQAEISSLPNPEEDEDHQVPQMPGFPGSYGSPGSSDHDYEEDDQSFGPGTCRYGGKVYVSAQQIPRDDPCDFCFCFRSDIICLQQSCPPPIQHCHEEPIQGFCCPRYECPVSMGTVMNVTTTTTTTTTTLPPHFLSHAYKGQAQRRGCQIKGHVYQVGEVIKQTSGPCLHCICGRDGQMKCDPKVCTPEPMLRQMIAVAATSRRR